MKITADTNVLVRAVMRDDEKQARAAAKILKDAEIIAVPLPCLCELAWVLRRVYSLTQADICAAIEVLLEAANVVADRVAAEAGLTILRAGGDFADGAIAYEGQWLGGETFVSFDKEAVSLLAAQGIETKLLT